MSIGAKSAHPTALRLIVQLSDLHFRAEPGSAEDAVVPERQLAAALAKLEDLGRPIAAILLTGDLADAGAPTAYTRIRTQLEPFAERLGTPVIALPGNHDDRAAMRRGLGDWAEESAPPAPDAPLNTVRHLGGLRLITLDTTLPGFHHGALQEGQLDWLAEVIQEPAADGTLLFLHHPPIRTGLDVLRVLELRDQEALAEILAGSDVRSIHAGHLHYPNSSMFAGIPVHVAGALSSGLDPASPHGTVQGLDGFQAFSLIEVYPEDVVVSSTPVGPNPELFAFPPSLWEELSPMSEEERIARFSRKPDGH